MLDVYCDFHGIPPLTSESEYGHLPEHFYFHEMSPQSLLGFNHGRTEKNTEDIFSVIPKRFDVALIYLDEVLSVCCSAYTFSLGRFDFGSARFFRSKYGAHYANFPDYNRRRNSQNPW